MTTIFFPGLFSEANTVLIYFYRLGFWNNSIQAVKKALAIRIVIKNHSALYSTDDDMVQGFRPIYAGSADDGAHSQDHVHNANV